MGISLYRQYRPRKFSEVVGQPAAVDVLVKSLRRERVGQAYLFSGPRGCGKTTLARLLAKALNCLSPADGYEPCCECRNCVAIAAGESLDVIEIDGASNNSVDEVRDLKSHVTLAPFASKYKIYIIDEVHMLSISAFNALLKTLEEPPACVVFVLATTEAHKVPVTIRSRCQHIPFHRIETRKIYDRLVQVCENESVAFQSEALREIARQADGALRDALSMLEQVANLGREEISLADVEATLGQGSRSTLERWVGSWRDGDMRTFCELDRMLAGGASPQHFLEELFSLCRDLWLFSRWSGILETLDASDQEKEYLKKEAPLWKIEELESLMRFIAELLPQTRLGLRMDVLSGLLMAKMGHLREDPSSLLPTPARQEKAPAAVSKPQSESALPAGKTASQRPERKEPEREIFAVTEGEKNGSEEKQSSPPVDSSAWEAFPDDTWNEAMSALHDREFLLYCGLLDARPFTDGGRLILDMPFRYCYEVLRLDRNRLALKKALSAIRDGEIVLRHGDRTTACDGVPGDAGNDSGANGGTRRGTRSAPGGFEYEIPADIPEEEAGEREVRPAAGVPFDGLVRGVQRYMRGEVILIRRGADEEEGDDIPPAEE